MSQQNIEAKTAAKVPVTIDGKTIEVIPGTTVLAAAKQAGIFIPSICDSEMLEPYGACRVCSVEVDLGGGKTKMVTSCNYPVRKPLTVNTQSERALRTRKLTLEMMLARWPNVKVVRDMAKHAGVETPRFTHPKRNESENACILCGKCVRICREGVWQNVLGFEGRGPERRVTMPFDKPLPECVGCGACAYICPTGAIQMKDDPNGPADWGRIRKAGMVVTREMILLDDEQCGMRRAGTGHLVEIMDDYDLLPVKNYRFGSHEDIGKISSPVLIEKYYRQDIQDGCALGCDMACAKGVDNFELKTGPDKGKRVLVDGPEYETLGGSTNMGIFDLDWTIEINYYCDQYGVDTISYCTLMAFVMECYEAGVLNKERTGGLDLAFGAQDAAMEVLHQMARGEGFGLVAGLGVRRMKKKFADEYGADPAFLQDIGMEAKGLEYSEYVTKESLAQQGGYGIALKGAQHDEAWLIFMDMVNKQIPTFEDKAEALHYFPMWRTWFGLNGLCKLPWNDVEPEDNAETDEPAKVPKHVQTYCDFFAGVTGKEVTPADLITQSERVYNFQRIFNLKMGFGQRAHDVIPYRSVGPVTNVEYESRADRYDTQLKEEVGFDPKGKSTDEKRLALRKWREDRYEKLLDAVYKRRGWIENGIPTQDTAKKLGIDKMDGLMELLKEHGA
ncbi:MAG: (2Fe-2S)-binding protein [Deltaproteobacteria bacterium]|nr:(2Fe-2S)-binding protein [Deltaproteobacteria bacterium]